LLQSPEAVFVELTFNGCASGAMGEEAEHASKASNIKSATTDLTVRISRSCA
jgi:hypothetical protein